jgi:predicted transcriptional regulator
MSVSFSMPVHWYVNAPVHTVRRNLSVNELHHRFIKLSVSSLPVVDPGDTLQGVVSRTDLLRCSFQRDADSRHLPLLSLPRITVADIMAMTVLTVDHEDTVENAANTMIRNHVHRVFVTKQDRLVGVLSARDVLPAVVDLHVSTRVGEFMATPLFVIAGDEPLETALSLLQQAHISGVVVLGDSGPEGVFTQADALLCRNLPRGTQVGDAMDTAIITIHMDTPLHLAAEQTIESRSKRVVVTDEQGVRGMITAFDFVRAASARA